MPSGNPGSQALSDLRSMHAVGGAFFVDFVLDNHPPVHVADFDRQKWQRGPNEDVDRKVFLPSLRGFEPTIDRQKWQRKWQN
jgi:hypothetical protein